MDIEITDKWNKFLDLFPIEKKDIYFTEEYVKFSLVDNRIPLCIICKEKDYILLMPFWQGKIENYFDFETPYGYGGPISNTENKEWISKALNEMNEYLKKQNYLDGFIRFHPLLKNNDYCRNNFTVKDDRNTIAIDLTNDIEQVWLTEISSKNRNMIRKAEKNGLIFEADYGYKYIEEFESLYNETMKRLDADSFYFFDKDYYKKYCKEFVKKGFLGIIKKDTEIVGAALFIIEKPYGHYHLAGSKRELSSLGINNFLLWNAAKEMKKNNVSFFHLGGGTNGDKENSLYKFKSSFSKSIYQFSIGKIIYNNEKYNRICEKWQNENSEKVEQYKNILLKYRY